MDPFTLARCDGLLHRRQQVPPVPDTHLEDSLVRPTRLRPYFSAFRFLVLVPKPSISFLPFVPSNPLRLLLRFACHPILYEPDDPVLTILMTLSRRYLGVV